MSDKTRVERAFEAFLSDPLVVQATSLSGIDRELLRVAFMEGAKHAVDRCKAAGHPAILERA